MWIFRKCSLRGFATAISTALLFTMLLSTQLNSPEVMEHTEERNTLAKVFRQKEVSGLPMSMFEWPLNVSGKRIVREYKRGTLRIRPITVDHTKITQLPVENLCQEKTLLTVLIKTRVEDRYNRDILRRTWVEDLQNYNLQHSFLIGLCKSLSCQRNLKLEKRVHKDIIQGDFVDKYHNNTLKFTMGLKYIMNYCNRTDYVLVIDGDYSLNVKRLLEYLMETEYPKTLYAGRVWPSSPPFREPGHPQYLSYHFYPFKYLPPFIAAGASLLSTELVEPLLIVSQFTKFVPFDDVFYGLVAQKLEISLVDATHLLPSYFPPPLANTSAHRNIIGSHRYGNLTEVYLIHKIIHGTENFKDKK